MNEQELIDRATTLLSSFNNSAALVQRVQSAINLSKPSTIAGFNRQLPRHVYGVALATTDSQEINNFATLYAETLSDLKVNATSKVTELNWRDITSFEDYKNLFTTASGGVLLIRDAFSASADKDHSLQAATAIASNFDKREFAQNAPVVILAGSPADMQAAFDDMKTQSVFVQKFMSRVGMS